MRDRPDPATWTQVRTGRRNDKPPQNRLRTLKIHPGRGHSRRDTAAPAPGTGGQESPPSYSHSSIWFPASSMTVSRAPLARTAMVSG